MSSYSIDILANLHRLCSSLQSTLGLEKSEVFNKFGKLPVYKQALALTGAAMVTRCLGAGIVIRNGKIILFFPSLLYDVLQHLFYPLNYVLGTICYWLPTRNSKWSESSHYLTSDIQPTTKFTPDIERTRKNLMLGLDVAHCEADLVHLYDACPPANSVEHLIGKTWNGRIVRTNRSLLDLAEWLLVRPLGLLGFQWGKRYVSQHVGDPLLVRWLSTIYFPLPVWGNVGMTDIRWRGVSTATMNYDHQPWKDYFRILSQPGERVTLLGVWTHKDVAGGWFTLTLDESVLSRV